MKGLALILAIDWRTSSSRSPNVSAGHSGLIPVSRWTELVVAEGEHSAIRVMDQHDFLGSEQSLTHQLCGLFPRNCARGGPERGFAGLWRPDPGLTVKRPGRHHPL